MKRHNFGQLSPSQARIACGLASLLLAVSAPSLLAQEVSNASDADDAVEVVEVIGVRQSLEDALNVKRQASSIVDAISATDIDALPALDLGEALQAIPGIQLNNDQEGRQSTISLRGLGGGFIKTTAFGQSFATPSAASNLNPVGSPNPFAAFEASIFDGVTVIKSPTADLQEGGVAGVVDKKLQQALSKKDGVYNLSIGGRFEELTGEIDENLRLSASKHIIDDKLAVAFKLGASGQTFRRDTFDIINYVSVDTVDDDVRATNIDEYRARWNLPENAVLTAPGRGRNVSEFSDGHRVSFAGNIEYQVNDGLEIGAHILYSKRDLNDGTKETTSMDPGFNTSRRDRDNFDARVTLDLETAPFLYEPFAYDPNGDADNPDPASAQPVFAVTNYTFTNGSLQNENRKTTFEEKSQGIIAYADYELDEWELNSKITHSESENNFENIGIGFRHNQDWRETFNFTDADGVRRGIPSVPTGFNGRIDTGRGSLDRIVVQGALEVPYVYDNLVWTVPNLSGGGLSSVSDANQGRRLQMSLNGRVRDLTRELSSIELSARRNLDFGFNDGFRLDAVKFGGRYSEQNLDSVDQRQGTGGVDTSNISSAFLTTNVLSATQNSYFDGNIPGTFDNTSGWVTLDNDFTIAALQRNIATSVEDIPVARNGTENFLALERNRSGFWDTVNRNSGLPSLLGFNFDAKQDIGAVYLTTDFSGVIGNVNYSGNLGVRHVKTDNTFNGFEAQTDSAGRNGVAVARTFKDSYSYTLPMSNVSFEVHPDVILRAAYYEGIVRPNLLSQRPTANFRGGNDSANLTLPSATVKPYEAKNYDLSVEWYNRQGSAITIGFFQKDITNLFDSEPGYCPEPGEDPIVDNLVGDLRRAPSEDGDGFRCEQITPIIDDEGNENIREVRITAPINIDEKLKVEGFELAVQQKLDFLPYPFNGFGGVFNYTQIDQKGDEALLTRVSPESFNLIGYWENDDISLRLAYNWRDDQVLRGANSFLGTNTRIRAATERLDFVGSYQFNKNLKVFLRAFNLTDDIGREYLGVDERAISRLTYTGRIYQLALNYKF